MATQQRHLQDEVHRRSLADPEGFWAEQAAQLHWHKQPTSILRRSTKTLTLSPPRTGGSQSTTATTTDKSNGDGGEVVEQPDWEWFGGGEISTCYNCVDRHVLAGRGGEPAVFYDSPVTGAKETLTYKQLLDEVEVAAGALREEGVRRGDVVLVYMPMIPAALVGILAINRLGAVHTVVFGGFASAALAQRIDAARPAAILAASCGVIDGVKPPVAYRPLIREAVRQARHKPARVLVWQRPAILRWEGLDRAAGERDWEKTVRSCRARGIRADCVPVGAGEAVYVIYTSGTTGAPKGVERDAGGHAVGLHLSITYLFGIRGPGDVIFTASDIGWVVGHSYIIYGPLLAGAATVLFEGKPVGTPDASTFWRIVRDYKVTTLSTAPTALRAIKRDDPQNLHLKRIGEEGGLRTLQALFLAGERSEPSIVTMYQGLLDAYGAPGGSLVIDNWWSSESGSPISGISVLPHTTGDRRARVAAAGFQQLPPIKPGSAGKPMPGFDVRVVDDEGGELKPGKMGNIVLAMPLAPTGFRTLWRDEERFYKSYLRRFDGKWIDTGDAGMIDAEGYISIMARSDDLINTAGHRLSTGAIEQAITSHPLVAEASVVGIPDALKGQLPFAFVTLSAPEHPPSAIPEPALREAIQRRVRDQIGGIAALGGIIQGRGMIPKTRSGKTLRRVLRELVENAVHGEFERPVAYPATIEDAAAVEVARRKVAEYWDHKGDVHQPIEERAKL